MRCLNCFKSFKHGGQKRRIILRASNVCKTCLYSIFQTEICSHNNIEMCEFGCKFCLDCRQFISIIPFHPISRNAITAFSQNNKGVEK